MIAAHLRPVKGLSNLVGPPSVGGCGLAPPFSGHTERSPSVEAGSQHWLPAGWTGQEKRAIYTSGISTTLPVSLL